MRSKYHVYWIHLPSHKDIFSEGYIGVAVDPDYRLYDHKRLVENGTHVNKHLSYAISKYGDKIKQTVLFVGSKDYCFGMEYTLRPEKNIGWNNSIGGLGGPLFSGYKHTQDTKKKMSRPGSLNPMWKRGDLRPEKGKTYEEIYGIEKAKRLREQRSASCKKLRARQRKVGWINPQKGKPRPEILRDNKTGKFIKQ